jgi:hypothetical protein
MCSCWTKSLRTEWIVVGFYVGAGDFSVLRCVQTCPEAHLGVYLMVNRDCNPGLIRPKLEDDDSPTSSTDAKNAWNFIFILFRFSWRSAKLSTKAHLPYGPNDIYKSTAFEPLRLAHYFPSVIKLPWQVFLPWLKFIYPDWGFSVLFSSVVRQMPGYNSQRRGTVLTLPN